MIELVTKEACISCKFSILADNDRSRVYCRRYPATVVLDRKGNPSTFFPVMLVGGWCGEYVKGTIQ